MSDAKSPVFSEVQISDENPNENIVVSGFQFVKSNGDHKSSCKWMVKLACSGFIIGEIIRFNLECNGQIAWRAVDRVGNHAGYGRTRGDAAFGLLCAFDQSCFGAYAVDSLVAPPEYTKKLQDDAAKADSEFSANFDLSEPDFELSAVDEIGRLQNQRLKSEVEELNRCLEEDHDKIVQLEKQLGEAHEELNEVERANGQTGGASC